MGTVPVHTRVVVRYLLFTGSATDALGELIERDERGCTVATRLGPERIPFTRVIAARTVPPPPPRRLAGA